MRTGRPAGRGRAPRGAGEQAAGARRQAPRRAGRRPRPLGAGESAPPLLAPQLAPPAAAPAAQAFGNITSLSKGGRPGGQGSAKRLRVAVDVDEVLGRFVHSLNQFCLEEWGASYGVADYKEYNFAKVWGCSRDEANERVHRFFESHHFAAGILPIPGALHSLQRLKECCELVVVTSRQHCIQQPTLAWLQRHFPDVFEEVHFGNHWALVGESRKKSEICRDIGAAVLIDDNPAYALDCAEAGLQVLLYDWRLQYPWAKTADGPTHPLIRRVQDWAEVESSLRLLSAEQRAAS